MAGYKFDRLCNHPFVVKNPAVAETSSCDEPRIWPRGCKRFSIFPQYFGIFSIVEYEQRRLHLWGYCRSAKGIEFDFESSLYLLLHLLSYFGRDIHKAD